LLRRADGPTDRETLADELGTDAGERRLAFLEWLGVLAGDDDPRPGPVDREYLDTDDEAVLHGALAAASDGFDATTEALAVRPPTDVEMVDLLSATLDSAVDPTTAKRYHVWLRALGYLTRDDGVNELTRKGRRLVVTTDRLAPGAADRDGAESGPEPTAGSSPEAEPPPPAADRGAGTDADRETLERDLRARHDDVYVCMLCGDRRQCGPEAGHAVVHYLMPPAPPYDGPLDAGERPRSPSEPPGRPRARDGDRRPAVADRRTLLRAVGRWSADPDGRRPRGRRPVPRLPR